MKIRQLLSLLPLLTLLTACGEDVSGGEALVGGIGIYLIGSLVLLALLIYAVLDLVKQPYPIGKKLIWGAIMLFIPYLGAIAYLIVGRGGDKVF